MLAKGWCRAHYTRSRANNGDPGQAAIRVKVSGRVCCFDGCVNRHDSNGLCAGHNYQRKQGQELRPLEARRSHSDRDADGNRLCVTCGQWLPTDQFHRNGNVSDGLSVDCANCNRTRGLLRKYGLKPEQYADMLARQKGACDICHRVNEDGRALAVDHDHSCCPGDRSCGLCVRGLLCSNCNFVLGLIGDSRDRLASADWYLRKHGK